MKAILFAILFVLPTLAADLTSDFHRHYEDGLLSPEQVATLRNVEVILIPGFMSETFISDDGRSRIDLSLITKDYYGTHLRYLQSQGIPARRLKASSASVTDTRNEIAEVFASTQRPLFFFTHSLGGMALLDHLLENQELWPRVSGIIFLQSPFTGAPVSTVVQKFPALSKVFPFFNVSTEMVRYLSPANRKDFFVKNEVLISELRSQIPVLTVGGIANGYKSLFGTSVTLIKRGCLKVALGRCVGPKVYAGPYDKSDGMVPFEGSKLPDADYVMLKGADHGETIVRIPYRGYDHKRLTSALLKLIL